jgi:Ni,Fe-hydrogenase III large subunit
MTDSICIHNGEALATADIPHLSTTAFRDKVCHDVASGARLAGLLRRPRPGGHSLLAVLADDASGLLRLRATDVDGDYPSLTPDCHQAHLFEREIFEQHGLQPSGHPWLKPVRFPRNSRHLHKDIGRLDFFQVAGEEVHEVAVGPVHAGVIEPGHFRFQCHGETVFHLEISLGYQHRGVEQALMQAPPARRRRLIETASGDSTAGHTLAYCHALEALAKTRAPGRAQVIRGIALELERIACHIGDLGALSGDVGFLPTASYCGRIRGVVLNQTAELCGNRFSRGLLLPGGVGHDLTETICARILKQLDGVRRDVTSAVELLWDTPSVLGRFEGTGVLSKADARDLGLVGPAARASGLARDVRHDFAHGIYQFHQIPPAGADTGDVLARAKIRWIEILRSLTFCEELLQSLPDSPVSVELAPLQPGSLSVSLTEGWRGEICHIAGTDEHGRLDSYKIIDPSFHNWFGLACALRNEGISDFPVCNKSFNLSYCGFDL